MDPDMSAHVQTRFLKRWTLRAGGALTIALLCIAGTQTSVRAQQVVLMVNGAPITSYDIEQRGKLIQVANHRTASGRR